jgi:hypothetical protein
MSCFLVVFAGHLISRTFRPFRPVRGWAGTGTSQAEPPGNPGSIRSGEKRIKPGRKVAGSRPDEAIFFFQFA